MIRLLKIVYAMYNVLEQYFNILAQQSPLYIARHYYNYCIITLRNIRLLKHTSLFYTNIIHFF